MSTSSSNVTAEKLNSANVKYNNLNDADRAYDITANVNIQNGSVSNFESGTVSLTGSVNASNPEGGGAQNLASFSSYSETSLNFNVYNSAESEAKNILTAIYAFMADVKANVTANPVTA